MVRNSGVPSRYDLVLMDLQMPVMGGLMATSEIRKIPAYENLPIIAMTADAMVGVQEKCLEAGMLDFISKPINPDMMFETIEKWIVTKPNPGTADLPAIQKAEDVEIPIHDMEGVDIEDGLRHVAGNRKLYLELLTKFFRSNEHFAAIVKNKWLAGSADESLRMMHTLKGLSGNLGMLNLHEACKRSEKALGADGVDDVHAVLGPVEEQLNIVIRSLKTNLVKAETPVHEIELGKVLPMVDQLEKLLRDNDPEAVNVLKQIGRVNGYEKEFQEVSTLLQDYDFEKALEFLKIIKVNLK
jgi:polar amino acid transport system substrate-binding protein